MTDEIVQIGSGRIHPTAYIRRQRDFARMRAHAERSFSPLMVANILPSPDGTVKLGVIVSKRFNNKAVHRNRARRLMKEAFRLLRHGIVPPVWIVLIARKRLQGSRLIEVQQELIRILMAADVFSIVQQESVTDS